MIILYLNSIGASGCRSCAEKARARRRAQRWQRMRVWLGGAPAALPRRGAVRRKPAPARTPAKRLEDMVAAPPAEEGLRYVAERSPEYLALLPRLASLEPADSWQADGLHHFLYQLHPEEQGRMLHALFITRRGDDAPLVATLVTTDPDGRLMGTVNLRAAAPKG